MTETTNQDKNHDLIGVKVKNSLLLKLKIASDVQTKHPEVFSDMEHDKFKDLIKSHPDYDAMLIFDIDERIEALEDERARIANGEHNIECSSKQMTRPFVFGSKK